MKEVPKSGDHTIKVYT